MAPTPKTARPYHISGENLYEIDKILESALEHNILWYRVKFIGRKAHAQDWYPAGNFRDAPLALRKFHSRNTSQPGPPMRLRQWLKACFRGRVAAQHQDDNRPDLLPLTVVNLTDHNEVVAANEHIFNVLQDLRRERSTVWPRSLQQTNFRTSQRARQQLPDTSRSAFELSLHRVTSGHISKTPRTRNAAGQKGGHRRGVARRIPRAISLLSLPPELRLMVYDSIFSVPKQSGYSDLAITRTNRLIYEEASGQAQNHARMHARINDLRPIRLDAEVIFRHRHWSLTISFDFPREIDSRLTRWFQSLALRFAKVPQALTRSIEIVWDFRAAPNHGKECLDDWKDRFRDAHSWFDWYILPAFENQGLEPMALSARKQITLPNWSVVVEKQEDDLVNLVQDWIDDFDKAEDSGVEESEMQDWEVEELAATDQDVNASAGK
jgi:hypothetical protein